MAPRKIVGQGSIVALMFALVFTPLAATANDLPQSGSETVADSGADTEVQVPGSPKPSESAADATPELALGDDERNPPGFDATYLEMIVDAVQEDPGLTLDQITEEIGLPTGGPLSPIQSDGMLSVSINFAQTPTTEDIANVEVHAQVSRVLDVAPTIVGYADPLELRALQELPGVVEVEVNLAPDTAWIDKKLTPEEQTLLADAIAQAEEDEALASTSGTDDSCRSLPAVANGPLKVTDARLEWGVDGTGVTVGILSSTYDEDPSALTRAAQDVQAGLLPGTGNPCGYTQPVRVLNQGGSPPELRNDEGRAMAQIVHGIAPGASLVVTTLGRTPAETAQNIADLVDAGADVITDDIVWSNEPNYQKGIISQQIDIAKSKGVSYFASSGNNNAVQAVGSSEPTVGYPIGRHQSNVYVPTACPSWVLPPEGVTSYDCMDFSPNGSGVPYGLVRGTAASGATYANLGSFHHILSWSEPVNGIKTRLQLQYYSLRGDGGSQGICYGGASMATNSITPARIASWDQGVTCQARTGGGYNAAMVVLRNTSKPGYGAPQVQITPFGPSGGARLSWREFHKTEGNNVLQSTQIGHDGDGSAWSVAASPFFDPMVIEDYSSLGSNEQWFQAVSGTTNATPLPQKVTPEVPVLTGLDGIVNNFFGSRVYLPQLGGYHWAFFGTSASAPTAAAVAALGLEKDPSLAPDALVQLMQDTANKNVSNPYAVAGIAAKRVTGAGLIDAQAFLNAVPTKMLEFTKVPVPVVLGSGVVGGLLSVAGAGVSDFVPRADGVAYQWLRNGVVIAGATGSSYMPVVGDVGRQISVRVTGSKAGYEPASRTSAAVTVAQPPENKPSVTRLFGSDRYGTNDAVNKSFGVKGAPVFVATGADFADALSIGPAVGVLNGTLFLTPRNSVDQKTLNAMKALSPSQVYIVGGKGAVSDGVAAQVKRATNKSPVRVSGKNRYDTSEQVYRQFFAGRAVATAFVATGRDFPDALSAASAGAALRAPVLLVDGKTSASLSPFLMDSLKGKNTSHILISGGVGAVNKTIEYSLTKSFAVDRLSGPDRYATNAAVNAYVGKQASSVALTSVWLATGRDFPDALSAAAPSGKLSSRLVLSDGKCIPKPVVSSWLIAPGSQVKNVYLAGGKGVLSQSVENLTECK